MYIFIPTNMQLYIPVQIPVIFQIAQESKSLGVVLLIPISLESAICK